MVLCQISERQLLWCLFFKKGDGEDPGNYTLVSLTCVACKLLEHIVFSHLGSILEGFCPEKHGFRRGLSCATQLVSTTNSLMASIDRGVSMHGQSWISRTFLTGFSMIC